MSIYDELQPVASELLKEFKQGVIQLEHVTPGSGPGDEPGEPTVTVYELDAVANGVSYKFIANGFAVASDLQVTSAIVSGVQPSMSDFILIDKIRYKIIHIAPVPAAGVKIVWKFIVREV